LEDLGAPFGLPGLEILRPAMEKCKALAGLSLLAFDKGVEAPKRRALPTLGFIGCRSRLQRREKIGSLRSSGPACDGHGAQPPQEFTSSKRLPHDITPFSALS